MPMNRRQCQPAAAMPALLGLNGSEVPCASALFAMWADAFACPRFGFLEYHQVGRCERKRLLVRGQSRRQ